VKFGGSCVQMKIDGQWVTVGNAWEVTCEPASAPEPEEQVSVADLMRKLKRGFTYDVEWHRPPRRLRSKAEFVPRHSKGLRNRWGEMK